MGARDVKFRTGPVEEITGRFMVAVAAAVILGVVAVNADCGNLISILGGLVDAIIG